MIKVDLITGFLGAGKTTFLKKYARYLMTQGVKVGVIENDFGAVNVDMMLLDELRGELCEIEMVSGGCDGCTYRRRLKTKLIAMGMQGYQRVIIEPSGIFETEEFFDILHEEPLERWYEIGNVFAILDAGQGQELSEEAQYLLASQTANAGKVILSRSQEVTEEQKQYTIQMLNDALEHFKCERRFDKDIEYGNWETFGERDYERLLNAGYQVWDYEKLWFENKEVFDSLYFLEHGLTLEEVKNKINKIFLDKTCGNVFRIKGFLPDTSGEWLEINATSSEILSKGLVLKKIKRGQEVIIVIGEGLNKDKIAKILKVSQNQIEKRNI